MAWIFLMIAGVFEVVWATFLKLSEGFSKTGYTICTFVGMAISFYFLAQATKVLPLGTAYAIWTGIGALGAVIVGVLAFQESLSPMRAIFLLCLLTGIVGLKFSTGTSS